MTYYTIEQLKADTRHLYASEETLKSVYDFCNQQEIYDACKSVYSVVHFQRGEPFLTQSPDIIQSSYQLEDGQSLYAVLKDNTIHSIIVTDEYPAPHSKKVIEELAKSDAAKIIKDTLITQVQLNHDAYVSAIKQETAESAQEELVIELMNRGVL